MILINDFPAKLKRKKGTNFNKIALCIFFMFIFTISSYYLVYNRNQEYYHSADTAIKEFDITDIIDLNIAAGPEIFVDPYKVNFSKIWNFFRTNYKSDLDMNADTYYRIGDNLGDISFDKVYSIDNLLLYKTLLKDDTDAVETFDTYLKLRESPLWYQDSINQSIYGFVSAVDNTTGEVFDSDRYLIDNLTPIFLLIENIGDQINSININSLYPKDSIEEIFSLINSSQFWDNVYEGFYDKNSTTDRKYAESNLYAILAFLEIHRIYEQLGLSIDIKNRAYELANITLTRLVNELWDNSNGGFEYYGKNDWASESFSDYKYLKTNAMGIITLLEYWKESGMQSDSVYIQNATFLYNKLGLLWNDTHKAYEWNGGIDWGVSGADDSIDLEANSIMMSACLKLFEYTGNITYYTQAWKLFNTFESSFYDDAENSYKFSIEPPINDNKSLYANLRLCEAYLTAFEIYSNTQLTSEYNETSEIPDFIFNQDVLNITNIYSYKKTDQFYNITTSTYESFTIEYQIDTASISYIFKNPENEILNTISQLITNSSTTFLYNITDTFEIGQGYYLQIFVNSTNFGTSHELKRFNVVSGLVASPILGLPAVLYQGPINNVTIPINNTRNQNLNLTVSMEGIEIFNELQNITFNTFVLTNVSFNLTATLGATIGPHTINFIFKEGNTTYLEISKIINIGHSFDYSNLIYQNTVAEGVSAFASLTLINFLPNSTQSLNISFYEDESLILRDEILLIEEEIKTVFYDLDYTDTETHTVNVTMRISKGVTEFYSEQFDVEIIEKFEIISASFPETIISGSVAQFILIIQNNQEDSEPFVLYVNGVQVETNLNGLGPGINRIVAEVIPSINPYDFGKKSYMFEIKNSLDEPIAKYYFEIQMELSSFTLVLFYILPVLIPICIILIYKNKEIKNKMLRR